MVSDDASPGAAPTAFERLEAGIAEFTKDVVGAGFDLPGWLEALQREVDRVEAQANDDGELPDPELPIPHLRLTRDELRRQVRAISEG